MKRVTTNAGRRRLVSLAKTAGLMSLVFAFALSLTGGVASAAPLAVNAVGLGTASGFAVLAGSAISDAVTTSKITGNVGLDPTGGASITGLTCAEVTGTIYDNNGGYTGNGGGSVACRATNAGLLAGAKNDLTTAYNNAAGQTPVTTIATELGGQTLHPGIYDSAAGTFGVTGNLTLDAQGDPNAVFIFKAASTLITASNSSVSIINSAQSCNVFWQVGSSATLGTGTTLRGTVMALASITDNGGSTVDGRLLARNAAVTLSNTTITVPSCTTTAAATQTAIAAPTQTNAQEEKGGKGGGGGEKKQKPAISGLGNTGGAPIQNAAFPWGLVVGGFGIVGLGLGALEYRRTHLPKH